MDMLTRDENRPEESGARSVAIESSSLIKVYVEGTYQVMVFKIGHCSAIYYRLVC